MTITHIKIYSPSIIGVIRGLRQGTGCSVSSLSCKTVLPVRASGMVSLQRPLPAAGITPAVKPVTGPSTNRSRTHE